MNSFLIFVKQKLLDSPRRRFFWGLMEVVQKKPTETILEIAFRWAFYQNLEGDYLEFGVYKGQSFSNAFYIAQKLYLNAMKFYAFDSFDGLPEIKGIDASTTEFSKGQFSSEGLENFKKIVTKRGVDLKKVVCIPGWYSDTLNEQTKKNLPLKKAAIIYIDCDLYESTVPVLDFITGYLQDGTVIIFDDWGCYRGHPNRGEQKAFNEWRTKNKHIIVNEFHKFNWHGNSFIVNLEFV